MYIWYMYMHNIFIYIYISFVLSKVGFPFSQQTCLWLAPCWGNSWPPPAPHDANYFHQPHPANCTPAAPPQIDPSPLHRNPVAVEEEEEEEEEEEGEGWLSLSWGTSCSSSRAASASSCRAVRSPPAPGGNLTSLPPSNWPWVWHLRGPRLPPAAPSLLPPPSPAPVSPPPPRACPSTALHRYIPYTCFHGNQKSHKVKVDNEQWGTTWVRKSFCTFQSTEIF